MAAAVPIFCERQQSTDSGWDNPFRPGGDLSREADEIVNMIKGGKPITPTEDKHLENIIINTDKCSHGEESFSTKNTTQYSQNGITSVQMVRSSGSNGTTTTQTQIANKLVPGPTSACHVVIGEKNKKKGCCVMQ